MLEARAKISHFKPWARQPDLLEGSSPLAMRSSLSDCDCGSSHSQLSCLPHGYYTLVARVGDGNGHRGSIELKESVHCF